MRVSLLTLLSLLLATGLNAGVTGLADFAPSGTLQLYPSVFVTDAMADSLSVEDGDPVLLRTKTAEKHVWCYRASMDQGRIGVHTWLRDSLSIKPDSTFLSLRPVLGSCSLEPRSLDPYMVINKGDVTAWPRMILGAPHGDCDLYTSEIVEQITAINQMPSLAAFNFRYSGLGRWIDVNRPLGRAPRPGGGVLRERSLWEAPRATYAAWRKTVREAGECPDADPLKFYCSFHGHDLGFTLPDGTRKGRDVVEGMGTGFSKDELRLMKSWYVELAPQYYDDPPLLVFGNLPEDRKYILEGQELSFFYSGYGARSYGILKRDESLFTLHFETPNSLRFDPEDRKRTAAIFAEIFTRMRDEILLSKTIPDCMIGLALDVPFFIREASIEVPQASYWLGAPEKEGWSAERPRHAVDLSSFSMDVCEVSNERFVTFANEALESGEAILMDGSLCSRWNPDECWALTASVRPWSDLLIQDDRLVIRERRATYPIVYVSWNGAQAFARSQGKRLPTEAEWEATASGSMEELNGQRLATSESWINWADSRDPFEIRGRLQTWPVGFHFHKKGATSPQGCLDMSGNVSEWCSDFYSYGYYREDPPTENPGGPTMGTLRSCRGGSWAHELEVATVSFRIGLDPNACFPDVGFRCAGETE